ncbi:glycosyltransferase family 4 protein [Clostridium estertheticum]|uniref:glycosyltransferase family 4 protein n=1 Tax=Clostridium estertheticum TaxID=238834 RepID=UPI001C0D50AD|nr:glycosyltransferase family 4 protein [Clostridium estertheticum]MBU3176436.1 glycosyltransferase family 4 protein [Clostridium estertheticum]
MIKVVHVTAHLGGGIGKILSSVAIFSKDRCEVEHIIIALEQTQTTQFEKLCRGHNIKVLLATKCDIECILNQADIVQLDWWHHPLTSEFMAKYLNKIKCRLLVWSHISGCSYPYISPKAVLFPDAYVFTTPYSYENRFWSDKEREEIIGKSYVVISSGLDFDKPIEKKKHSGFNVGYIGFLGYNKMHPNFVKYCEGASDIPNVKFNVVGETSFGKQLLVDVYNSKLVKDKIIFEGYSLNVLNNLAEFDVFGYPLNPNHYGTAENVLLEAMAAGIVPVVLNQCTEKYIVKNMKTGLLVNNISEYANALRWLYENPIKRNILAVNASEFIIKDYCIKSTVEKMNKVYYEVLKMNKHIHDADPIIGKEPYEWFLSCYKGNENKLEGNAFAETKGSAKHYLKYFSEDKKLRKVVEKNESRIKTIL